MVEKTNPGANSKAEGRNKGKKKKAQFAVFKVFGLKKMVLPGRWNTLQSLRVPTLLLRPTSNSTVNGKEDQQESHGDCTGMSRLALSTSVHPPLVHHHTYQTTDGSMGTRSICASNGMCACDEKTVTGAGGRQGGKWCEHAKEGAGREENS